MISIVYVNYKTASLVIDSIKSVKENTTGVDYDIIVFDKFFFVEMVGLITVFCYHYLFMNLMCYM